ncbi:MAG: DNA polymerase III subunit beta [Clostridia bacterium]|nr:DNA polymerase III subunit beta [Clostridia bacterium]
MKFFCQKQALVDAVNNVTRAVSNRSTIPALEGILLRATSSLFLAGYDMEIGITTNIEAQVQDPGEIVLGSKQFGDIVRRLPDDLVSIEANEKLSVTIRSGTAEFQIIGISAADFPELPSVSDGMSLSLPQNMLKSMIRQTLFAVAPLDSGKPVHTGTLFEAEGDVLRLVSVDGSRLAIRTEAVKSNEQMKFVVPGKTLSEVLKLLQDEEAPVFMAVGRRHIVLQIDGYAVISRLLDGEFLAYRKAIPVTKTTTLRVKTRDMIDAVERVSLVVNDRVKSPLVCKFDKGIIELSCTSAIGSASDSICCEMEGVSEEIAFNSRFMLDALKNSESDEVTLELGGAVAPMKLLPSAGDSFLFLVLPVRMKK